MPYVGLPASCTRGLLSEKEKIDFQIIDLLFFSGLSELDISLCWLVCDLQEAARRRRGWSVDTVYVGSEVLRCYKDDVKTAPTDGVYVHGLVIDNAAWDARNSRIVDAKHSTVGYLRTSGWSCDADLCLKI